MAATPLIDMPIRYMQSTGCSFQWPLLVCTLLTDAASRGDRGASDSKDLRIARERSVGSAAARGVRRARASLRGVVPPSGCRGFFRGASGRGLLQSHERVI